MMSMLVALLYDERGAQCFFFFVQQPRFFSSSEMKNALNHIKLITE